MVTRIFIPWTTRTVDDSYRQWTNRTIYFYHLCVLLAARDRLKLNCCYSTERINHIAVAVLLQLFSQQANKFDQTQKAPLIL